MRRFLWKIAGADCEILQQSGRDSQNSFLIIGILYLIIIILTYVGFFGMFWGLFRSGSELFEQRIVTQFVTASTGSMVMCFLVSNIYFLNLMSLEPKTLPVPKDDGSKWLTNIVRYSTVILFAFFVSKNVEVELFNLFESMGMFTFDHKLGYMDDLIRMNQQNPIVWMLTILIIGLFILPIYLRHRLNRAHEYYMHKRLRDKVLVKGDYDWYLTIKEDILREKYLGYELLYKKYFEDRDFLERVSKDAHLLRTEKLLKTRKYKEQIKKYSDEPFNTKERKSDDYPYKTSRDFLDSILQQNS
jgi:hypothetical protein